MKQNNKQKPFFSLDHQKMHPIVTVMHSVL